MKRALLLAAAVGGLVVGPIASAQPAYPSKTIRIVSPYAAGGSSDYMARVLAKVLSEHYKQPAIVENKPGAGGTMGTDSVAKSAPDGYSFLYGSIATHVIAPLLYPNIPYNSRTDFTPVTLVATAPSLMVVSASSKVQSIKDLLAAGRAESKRLSYGSAGAGSIAHLTTELLAHQTKIPMLHVPYKGDAPALADVMSGRVDFMFGALPSAMTLVRNGRLRAVAVSSTKRSAIMPDVPTAAEAGVPGFEVVSWWMLFAPANVPADVVRSVNAAIVQGLKRPDVAASFHTQGVETQGTTPEQAAAFLREQWERWSRDIASAGIKIN